MEHDFAQILEKSKKLTGLKELRNEKIVMEYIQAFGYDLEAFLSFMQKFEVFP